MTAPDIVNAAGRLRTRDQVVEMAVSYQAAITVLRSENAALRAALATIARMSTVPDDTANRMTLVAAHRIANEALEPSTKESA